MLSNNFNCLLTKKRVVTSPEDQARRGKCFCREPTRLSHITHITRNQEAALPLLLCWLLRPKKKDTDSLSLVLRKRVSKRTNTARFIGKEKKSYIFFYMLPSPLHVDTSFEDFLDLSQVTLLSPLTNVNITGSQRPKSDVPKHKIPPLPC